MSLGTSSPPRILINGSPLNVVDKFSYLGSIVNSSNNLDDEINQRIRKALTNFGQLSSWVWKNHHLAIKLKIKVYTACILSVLLYSRETWCTYCRQENRLIAFHFRCLRSILGVSWRDHVPNSTILHLTGSYDLTTIIRQRRLRCLGHVHHMEDGRLPKDILYSEFYNAPCRTGRPKLRYKDVIKRDIAGFHISPQSWETLAADRNRWCASLSFGYSLSATSHAEKMEKRRAHRWQRRDGPWWWYLQFHSCGFVALYMVSDLFSVSAKAIIWEWHILQYLLAKAMFWFINFMLEFACFDCLVLTSQNLTHKHCLQI